MGFSRACDFSDCSASIVLRVDGMLDVGNNDLRHHENALKLVFILFIILYAGWGGGGGGAGVKLLEPEYATAKGYL